MILQKCCQAIYLLLVPISISVYQAHWLTFVARCLWTHLYTLFYKLSFWFHHLEEIEYLDIIIKESILIDNQLPSPTDAIKSSFISINSFAILLFSTTNICFSLVIFSIITFIFSSSSHILVISFSFISLLLWT